MSEKKNIDRLFQERFKDFEIDPPESSWENISERLGNKRKRRILPFWWQRAGIAAALLIGIILIDQTVGFGPFKKTQEVNVTEVDNSNGSKIIPGVIDTKSLNNQSINDVDSVHEIVNASDGASIKKSPDLKSSSDKFKRSDTFKNNSGSEIATSENTNISSEADSNKGNEFRKGKKTGSSLNRKSGNADVATSDKNQYGSKSGSFQRVSFRKGKKSGVVSDENLRYAVGHHKSSKNRNSKTGTDTESIAATLNGGSNKKNSNGSDGNEGVASAENQKKSQFNSNPTTTKITDKKVTDNNTLTQMLTGNEKPAEKTKVDSVAIATAESLAMGELLNEKEKKSVTQGEQKINRWQVDTHVAPIYLSSLSNGSPIDPEFANNSKESSTTLSYGVGARYAIGKRLSVRTGVNSLAMEYKTNGVTFSQSAFARKQMEHVSTNMQGAFVNVTSQSSPINVEGFNINAQSKTIPGSISQKTGYIEVPLELTYSVIDKRFGVEIIGGMSTLFLQQNDISLISGDTEMSIGKADNLNATHFSTNLGLGLYYKLFRNMNFRVEPMVKYQLNAYSEAGNYKPYFFGIYTGLNYQF